MKHIFLIVKLLFSCLAFLNLVSCEEFTEYPENIGCGTEISVSVEVLSEVLSVSDITADSPIEVVKITIPSNGQTYRGYSTGVIDDKGIVTCNYPHVWKTEPVKFVAWWPASANVVVDDEGKIISISEDCKLIGETTIFTTKPKDAHIVLQDDILQ